MNFCSLLDGQRPIEMRLEDFEEKDGDDYGFPIEQYKKKLKEGNVFLIVNLNDVSTKLFCLPNYHLIIFNHFHLLRFHQMLRVRFTPFVTLTVPLLQMW